MGAGQLVFGILNKRSGNFQTDKVKEEFLLKPVIGFHLLLQNFVSSIQHTGGEQGRRQGGGAGGGGAPPR